MIDLTGQKFGRLSVIERDTTIKKGVYWKCICDCGNTKTIYGGDLRSGATQSCGCLNREIITNANCLEDLTGKRFGKLVVVKQTKSHVTPSGQKKARWICNCDCGNTSIVSAQDLKTGHTKSCGCLPTKTIGSGLIDLTGMRFGKLTVIKRTEDYVGKNGYRSPKWLCKCDCGNEVSVQGGNLRNGVVKHCGCDKIKSKGEEAVSRFLNENNIKHINEYYFDDLRNVSGNLLRFDFAILDDNNSVIALIEYQGKQHYMDYGEFGKYQRLYSDKKKKDYCKLHNIPLYEIRYDEDILSACETIITEIQNIYVNPVPNIV